MKDKPPTGVAERDDDDEYEEGRGQQGFSLVTGSFCMSCGGSGTTRMLETSIPYFREMIVSSFECDNCGWRNNEALFSGEMQLKGCRLELTVAERADLDRQVVKSDYATLRFVELEFEIPAKAHKGEITTVEGILSTAAAKLALEQPYRLQSAPHVGLAVSAVIEKLLLMAAGDEVMLPFTLVIDDPSGNSHVESARGLGRDPRVQQSRYARSPEQDAFIGLMAGASEVTKRVPQSTMEGIERLASSGLQNSGNDDRRIICQESMAFPEPCPSCHAQGETNMCTLNIPYFKEVIVMAYSCQACGFRSSEVKGGGPIPQKGTLCKLTARCEQDLMRDVLKSDTCSVYIPELELELEMGTLGSLYSTLEGLLDKVKLNLVQSNPFYAGDSCTCHHGELSQVQLNYFKFLERLEDLRQGHSFPFTVILKDPLGNSFFGTLYSAMDPSDDPEIAMEDYARSERENEDLGLHDMKTEGYETGGMRGDQPVEQQERPKLHSVRDDHPATFDDDFR